jgi:hypothetical protein
MTDDVEMVQLLHALGFGVTHGGHVPPGLHSDVSVARVVPGPNGFDVLDGDKVLAVAADEAGAIDRATAALQEVGGGHVHVYGTLHQIKRVLTVAAAPPSLAALHVTPPTGPAKPDSVRLGERLLEMAATVGPGTAQQPGFSPDALVRIRAQQAAAPATPEWWKAVQHVVEEAAHHAHLIVHLAPLLLGRPPS